MSTIADFNKAAAASALAFGFLKQKEVEYEAAAKAVQEATAANDKALEDVKALVTTLDADAIAKLQAT